MLFCSLSSCTIASPSPIPGRSRVNSSPPRKKGSKIRSFVSSSIPGPAIVTVRSAVAISLLEHQGGDGVFSAEETTVLGETFAHEAGHYLGLFHPVEVDDANAGTFTDEDPVLDTAVCTTVTDCVAAGVAENTMFPIPVGGGIAQQTLTTGQAGVLNLQVLVN